MVTSRGLLGDRLLMITDVDGEFLTQREHPRMALITASLGEELLTLRAPGMDTLDVPLKTGGPTSSVVIWRDTCQAVDQGLPVAQWLSAYLETAVRLVHLADEFPRPVDPRFARTTDDETSFADGYPFLLIGEESLSDLNGRLSTPLPMDRFRPNIVVRGANAYAEDGWQQIRIGDITFDIVKPCARCVMTTVDPERGEFDGKEPLATLSTYRRTADGTVSFGQNLLATGTGMIALGDQVEVLS